MIAGCAAAGPTQPPVAKDPSTAPTPGFLEGKVGRLRSHELDFPIELVLPDKPGWRIVEGPSWLLAEHDSTSSALALRTWRAERLVRRSECEAQARLGRATIPIVHDEAVVERHAFAVPAEFVDSELVVGVEPSAGGISGYALVIGAGVGRCYAAVFTTRVSGDQAELELAARLGLVVDRILSHVRVLSVDERAPRRHLVVGPKPARD